MNHNPQCLPAHYYSLFTAKRAFDDAKEGTYLVDSDTILDSRDPRELLAEQALLDVLEDKNEGEIENSAEYH